MDEDPRCCDACGQMLFDEYIEWKHVYQGIEAYETYCSMACFMRERKLRDSGETVV